MVGETVGSMSLEGFNVLIGLPLALLGFHSPCHCDASLVFGIGNSGRDSISLVKPCMDAMALFTRIEVKGCKTRRGDIQLLHVRLNSHVNNGVDASIAIRS